MKKYLISRVFKLFGVGFSPIHSTDNMKDFRDFGFVLIKGKSGDYLRVFTN